MIISSTWRTLAQMVGSRSSRSIHVEGIDGQTIPFAATSLHHETQKPVLLVASEPETAELWYEACRAWWSQPGDVGPVQHFPLPFVSPYIEVSTDQQLERALLGSLAQLGQGHVRIAVTSVAALASVVPPVNLARDKSLVLQPGQDVDRDDLVKTLADLGYSRSENVYDVGSFAVRGSLVDIWSPASDYPARLDFFGDEIESIAYFQPDNQLTFNKKVKSIVVAPATPVVSWADVMTRSRRGLIELSESLGLPTSRLTVLTDALRAGELPANAQALIPAIFPDARPLIDSFASESWVLALDDSAKAAQRLDRYLSVEADRFKAMVESGRLACPPQQRFLDSEGLSARMAAFTSLRFGALELGAQVHTHVTLGRSLDASAASLNRWGFFQQKARTALRQGFKVVLCTPQAAEVPRLTTALSQEHGLAARPAAFPFSFESLDSSPTWSGVEVYVSELGQGVYSEHHGLYLITTAELYDKPPMRRRLLPATRDATDQLFELKEGDFVVHQQHGIGRFEGVERRQFDTGENLCLRISYSGGDSIFVPVTNTQLISKFIGTSASPPKLDRLGGVSWANRVHKARSSVKKLAFDLLSLYAERQTVRGMSFSPRDDYFREFEASFPYQETPDQAKAVDEVLADMERPQPMDRVVCGDVGFGKTEVAIRAAFKAVLDGRQVAVLVPTTVLAEQHKITFQERLKGYPVRVESLSRFKSQAEQNGVLRDLQSGRVDIVVGTHRLLGKDVVFKDLGLLIIDEEHRFGVGHKERLKAMRTSVDILSMTATPIPRTLHMAISGIRDLSVIKTAPLGRQDIETHVIHWDDSVVAEAIRFELARQGQVFVLHNRVDDLGDFRDRLQKLVPEARIAIAHGQMHEDQLEKAMVEFIARKHDVLVCTTIIESGLDIPAANTLIVNHADRFGLAQLYQIRGRVGRSTARARAWFIVPPTEAMGSDARSRIAALSRYSHVGAGMEVAQVDMALRGVGDVLGAEQSGHIANVGFEMFTHLLAEAVEEIRNQTSKSVTTCEVQIPVEAGVPDSYIPERHQRMVLYRSIATAESLERLQRIHDETLDRFGQLPAAVENLFTVGEIRMRAEALGVSRISASSTSARLLLKEAADRVLKRSLELVRKQPVPVKVTPDSWLSADFGSRVDLASGPVACARQLLRWLEDS